MITISPLSFFPLFRERTADKEKGPPKLQLLESDENIRAAQAIVANVVASARAEDSLSMQTSAPALMANVTDINNNQMCLKDDKETKSEVFKEG